jgi:aryl-alcohol dehydrogenase-like predicted oxidoreductase
MRYRRLGKTGFEISEVSLGTWQVGGRWGSGFDDASAERILEDAIDRGVNFIDTADVYENRQSEAAVARVARRHSERIYIATKCGRFVQPHLDENYTPEALRGFVEASLRNTGLEALDLVQLHCPPPAAYYRPEIFELFDVLKDEGKILHLGVSVERVEEALKAIEYPNVTTIQIIFNLFRQRPAELFFPQAAQRDVGIIVRVPLASGLLSGKYDRTSTFGEGDHRFFNREGAAFDKGETFSGIPFETGLEAVDELKALFPEAQNLAPIALRWVLDHDEISTVIPGASRLAHVASNLSATDLPPIDDARREQIDAIYERRIRPLVHQLW